MKKLLFILLITLISCEKDKETKPEPVIVDTTKTVELKTHEVRINATFIPLVKVDGQSQPVNYQGIYLVKDEQKLEIEINRINIDIEASVYIDGLLVDQHYCRCSYYYTKQF